MDNIGNSVMNFMGVIDSKISWLNDGNSPIVLLLILVIIIYSAFFVGRIFPPAMTVSRWPIVKMIYFLAIVLVARYNVSVAIVLTIAVVTIMLTNLKNENEFMTTDDAPYLPMNQNCVCKCNKNGCNCACKNNKIIPHTFCSVNSNEQMHNIPLPTLERQTIDSEIQKEKGKLVDLDYRIYVPDNMQDMMDLYSYSADMNYSPTKLM